MSLNISQNPQEHGFFLVVPKHIDKERVTGSYDDFSVHLICDNNILVIVQAGTLSKYSAEMISAGYNKNRKSFVPERETHGSFIIVDFSEKTIFAGRDRSQAYHLYYSIDAEFWYFSTNQHSIIKKCKPALNSLFWDMYFQIGVVGAPFPLLKGIEPIMPGKYLFINRQEECKQLAFWEIERIQIPKNYQESVNLYGELLTENIKNHISEDSCGVFLSGGSDSAAVTGVINKLNIKRVHALHMEISNYPQESTDVALLHSKYGFHLEHLYPPDLQTDWLEQINEAIDKSQPGLFITFPMYYRMGKRMGELLPKTSTVFNGELVLLDQGFSVIDDKNRNFKRWLYFGGGYYLSRLGPIWPKNALPNWKKLQKPFLDKGNKQDIINAILSSAQVFFHALGRPNYYYGGLKLGFGGYPGLSFLTSLLHPDIDRTEVLNKTISFLQPYFSGLSKETLKIAIANMTVAWYSEASNFTMPLDASSAGKNNICFPFSSVGLMDLAVSIPQKWAIDKRIQKDMCYHTLDMPHKVAYRLKDHRTHLNYFDAVYGKNYNYIFDAVNNFDFGPLQYGLTALLNSNKPIEMKQRIVFSYYSMLRLIQKYDLTIE